MLRYWTDAAASKYWLVGTCMYMRWRVDPQRRFSQKTVQVAGCTPPVATNAGLGFRSFLQFRRSRHQKPPVVYF